MSRTNTTRRAVLAGAAALPALAAPAPASVVAASSSHDPIFAAIETHRAAFLARMRASKLKCDLNDIGAETIEAEEAEDEAREADCAAVLDLALFRPTTIEGALALIEHVHAFNRGAYAVSADEDEEWRSAPYLWPEPWEPLAALEQIDDDPDGACGVFYAILLNAHGTIAGKTVQS